MTRISDWFLNHRGIEEETLQRFGIREEEGVVVLPYTDGEKRRKGFFKGEDRRFWFTSGVIPGLYYAPGDSPDGKQVILCEGETDTMRTWQELQEAGATNTTVIGLSGIDTWKPAYAEELAKARMVYLVLDNDADYNVQARVDVCAKKIRADIGKKCRRIKLPGGVKDLCEFWNTYDVETLRLLMQKGRQTSRFQPLDLTIPPPFPNWLWTGFIAKGDVHLLSGKSGIGKSWLTMALTVAVADSHAEFLGNSMAGSGRVLYVDEENPEDVVYSRLKKLGLTNKHDVRYIWNNGVRVDKMADELLDEALDYEPALIILDSLTRVHSQEENNAGQMAPLLNDCIKPLARETGAAVVLIHHHDKAGVGARGSGDIVASVDTSIDVFPGEIEDSFTLKMSKSRRTSRGDGIFVTIRDRDDGVELYTPATQHVNL